MKRGARRRAWRGSRATSSLTCCSSAWAWPAPACSASWRCAALGHPFWPPLLPEPYVDNALLYRPSGSRRYELRPGADDVVGRERVRIRVNAAGVRDDREYAVPKPPGLRRVLVLGDSFTFAGKVRLDESFPRSSASRRRAERSCCS